ncbi:MAG: hypothetical protein CFE21_03275 [Bacteroidetes bacterium B1(2017)]|nr:MAG: hypothetical protein CFE21_03275 [Bacteroidetes bacterium B1(2017)]
MKANNKEKMKKIVKLTCAIALSLLWNISSAQVQDETTPGFDAAPDSTLVDTTAAAEPVPAAPVDPLLRPYERIVLSIDSATNLITYYGVVEQEESGSDSLYLRAKNWAVKNLNKDLKIESDKRNQKITYVGSIPAYAYLNKYSKRSIGRFEFKITFLIKEGRYKYTITNLVHETLPNAEGGKNSRNYFEYYYTSTTKVREYDSILRNADLDIQKLIESIKASMREPILVDEDDW